MKRVELIVKAFVEMPDKRLLVVSEGIDMSKIRRIAEKAPNIEVLGRVGEAHLCDLMGRCIATIFIPRGEDFGISPGRVDGSGKAGDRCAGGGFWRRSEGRSAEGRGQSWGRIVGYGYGVLMVRDPGVKDVVEAVEWMTPARALGMRRACEERAKLFDTDIFLRRAAGLIQCKV